MLHIVNLGSNPGISTKVYRQILYLLKLYILDYILDIINN